MDIAIVGGGINGVMTAWLAAQAGHRVELFERGRLMGETSSASSKLLHGGLRYLGNGEFRLVREALRERSWWLRQAPDLSAPLALILPLHQGSRPRWVMRSGLWLYDLMSDGEMPRHRVLNRDQVLELAPALRSPGLSGGYLFHDGLMRDDAELGRWAAERAREQGAQLHEGAVVHAVDDTGRVRLDDGWRAFDRVLNIAGPWAAKLLADSGLSVRHQLDLVRGSHVVLDQVCGHALLLQDPDSSRILFVLPYRGRTLFGTTEVRQALDQRPTPSGEELDYLGRIWAFHFGEPMPDPVAAFAGLRPLIRGGENPGSVSREYAIERHDNLVTVFGGKWTTSRALAAQVVKSML